MLTYVQGLIDSGMEPYPVKDKQTKISLKMLKDENILTQAQLNYIYNPVGQTTELPDTSSAWCCSQHISNIFNENHSTKQEHYCQIVEEDKIEKISSSLTFNLKSKSNNLSGLNYFSNPISQDLNKFSQNIFNKQLQKLFIPNLQS